MIVYEKVLFPTFFPRLHSSFKVGGGVTDSELFVSDDLVTWRDKNRLEPTAIGEIENKILGNFGLGLALRYRYAYRRFQSDIFEIDEEVISQSFLVSVEISR